MRRCVGPVSSFSSSAGRSIAWLTLCALVALGAPAASGQLFIVGSEADTHDAEPGDALCADTGGECTLRAAIEESNALGSSPSISVADGEYLLDLGELSIESTVTLVATNLASIRQTQADRVMRISAGASVHLQRLAITNGSAAAGAGILVESGDLDFADGELTENTATGDGGGILVQDSNASIRRVRIHHNDASRGGGVAVRGEARAELGDLSVESNTATVEGGGVFLEGYAGGGQISVIACNVDQNQAPIGAGVRLIKYSPHGGMDLAITTIAENVSTGDGSALSVSGSGFATLSNVTISANSGGAAADVDGGTLQLQHVTATQLGAPALQVRGSGVARLDHSVLSGNGAGVDLAVAAPGEATSIGHNHITDFGASPFLPDATDQIGGNPLLGALAVDNVSGRNHVRVQVPQPGSPLIDAGEESEAAFVDARAVRRPADGNGDAILARDPGAVEVTACENGIDDDGDGHADGDDVACSGHLDPSEREECYDGLDNDDDGSIDFDDSACATTGRESATVASCGLGVELVIAIPALAAWRRRRA
jgi:hypothetical protein